MFFNEDKNIALYNKQSLDTYHEIVVSFDYARYSRSDNPTGGFAVVFYRSNNLTPVGGGPDFALGYLPSNKTDYCKLDGYPGLREAILGVGFDLNGQFALSGPGYGGNVTAIPNSCTIRDGIEQNFKVLATSKNFLDTPYSFLQAEKIGPNEDPVYKTVKIIISRGFTNVKVQIKDEKSKAFYTVLETSVPQRERDAVRVAITSTILDDGTNFDIKNFNVVGFPGKPREPLFTNCLQTISLPGYSQGNTVVAESDFVAVPVEGSVYVYKLIGQNFTLDQIITESLPIVALGGSSKFLILGLEKTTNVVVYYYNNSKFFRTQDFNLFEDSFIGPDESLYFINPPTCADTDDQTLVFGNGTQVSVYQYIFNPNALGFGTWVPTGQTIIDDLSGSIGTSVQVENDRLLAGSKYGFVKFYLNNGFEFLLEQTIFDPVTGNVFSRFGQSMSLQNNDLIIGAPQAFKVSYNTVGQGEAYHYFYGLNRLTNAREWRRIMNIGNFFNIDTPGGEFGYSLKLRGNNLIVSAPFENYLNPPDKAFEDIPNCGRIYFFEKTTSGIFNRGATVFPDREKALPYSFFGKYVGFYSPNIGVGVTPYTPGGINSEVNFFNKDCIFDKPPQHLPISFQSIALVDNAGYMIDIETLTYMQLLCSFTTYDG